MVVGIIVVVVESGGCFVWVTVAKGCCFVIVVVFPAAAVDPIFAVVASGRTAVVAGFAVDVPAAAAAVVVTLADDVCAALLAVCLEPSVPVPVERILPVVAVVV